MAHIEQQLFFQELSRRFQERFESADQILEVGSLNINGTVRDFFSSSVTYLGVDIGPGDGVDLVIPGELLELPDGWADITISTECFEHATNWKAVLENMIRLTKAEGLVILTFAGFERTTHGTLDSDLGSSPFTPSYYQNLIPDDIYQAIQIGELFSSHSFEVNSKSHDTYFWGIRNSSPFSSDISSLRVLEEKLARSRGQLGQAIQKNAELSRELSRLQQVLNERDTQIIGLNQSVAERDTQIIGLNQSVAERDTQIVGLNQSVAERDTQIVSLSEEIVRRGEWGLSLDAELNEERAKVLALTRSLSWRITLPLRETKKWITSPRSQAKRYTKGTIGFGKRVYQALPLSFQTKARHRRWIAQVFPQVLLLSGSHSSTIPVSVIPQQLINQVSHEPIDNPMAFAAEILLPITDNPLVSVIIPIYGKIDYTLRCLASIAAHPSFTAFEIIVVDDCSPDESWEVLSRVKGLHLLRNEQNQGFILSCNTGAKAARGEYLHFLNNDTEVTPGWIDELLFTFDELPGTGLAGSKLIYPDGRLQEAGGIIWQDGSAWNFGRFQDPNLPVYNYAREVDYCSGASIMVPKVLFNELGGFDEHYSPAYCEDSDLALRIRDKGYRVIYQPLSAVIHHEGITSGTDLTQGVKSYQVENTRKLFERWKHRLQHHQAPGCEVDDAKDRMATWRALYLDHCTPTPNRDSGSIDAYNHMLLLREMGCQVTFIAEHNFLYEPEYTTNLQRAGIEVLYAPFVTSVKQHLKEFGGRYNLVFLSRPGAMERHVDVCRQYCPNARILFHTVDLHFLRMEREANLLQSDEVRKEALKMRNHEIALINLADIATVVSTRELAILKSLVPKNNVRLLPYSRSTRKSDARFQDRKDIVFVGGYQHRPNVDAVQYFVDEVMPLLRQQLPGIRFHVVGSNPTSEVCALASEDIIIHGFVDDLDSLLDQMRVSVAPLRYGAGIKGKVGTAMAVGLPVVATSLAVEGMSLTDEEHVLVADGSESLAHTITRIYRDENLWRHISENGLVFAEKKWGSEAAWANLATILLELGIEVKRGNHSLSLYSEVRKNLASNFSHLLDPVGSARNRHEFMNILNAPALKQITQLEQQILSIVKEDSFGVQGFCIPCSKDVQFLVDMQSGGQHLAQGWIPNWRERLECPFCRMNNRQRLIATLIKQALDNCHGKRVYFMEQVTPILQWASANFKQHHLIGSEYLGHEYPGGTVVKGIRHENIENLSFADDYLDLIISNDVFEHVPNPAKAFAECARVLKAGGIMLATIPFHCDSDTSVIRAQLNNGKVDHILPPVYHGNPISTDGSLVFTDFGWDLLPMIQNVGFSDVAVEVYASSEYGHLGGGQLVFRARL